MGGEKTPRDEILAGLPDYCQYGEQKCTPAMVAVNRLCALKLSGEPIDIAKAAERLSECGKGPKIKKLRDECVQIVLCQHIAVQGAEDFSEQIGRLTDYIVE